MASPPPTASQGTSPENKPADPADDMDDDSANDPARDPDNAAVNPGPVHTPPPPPPRVRTGQIVRPIPIGLPFAPHKDVYHFVLTRTWPQFFLMVLLAYLAVNGLFALAYAAVPGCLAAARPGSIEDGFYFSVQTFGTIGYGAMSPATRYAQVLVVLESLVGMISAAIMTGLTFAKFARPTARILFSNKITVAPRNGVPHMMFRMANYRGNQVYEAQLRVIVLVHDRSTEGHEIRRPIELNLVRDRNATFVLSWTAMHAIDEKSPFYGLRDSLPKLIAQGAEIYLTLTGIDETTVQTIHARTSYALEDIAWDHYFADVVFMREDGNRVIDYRRFHDVVPVGAPMR